MTGFGEGGQRGGPAGDLYIVIRVKPHPHFKRQETDVLLEVPVSFAQAALGTELDVPTLEGPYKLRIPEGTQSGDTFRLRGKGIAHLRGYGRGDQHVTVRVETPRKLSDKERELLQEFAALRGEPVAGEKGFFDKMRDVLGGR